MTSNNSNGAFYSARGPELIQKYETLRVFLRGLGFSLKQVAYSRRLIENAGNNEVARVIKWLEAFDSVLIRKYNGAKARLSDEQWQQHNALGPDWSMEQTELNSVVEEIKHYWSHRPRLLRKD
jgi:hypothetical protein